MPQDLDTVSVLISNFSTLFINYKIYLSKIQSRIISANRNDCTIILIQLFLTAILACTATLVNQEKFI